MKITIKYNPKPIRPRKSIKITGTIILLGPKIRSNNRKNDKKLSHFKVTRNDITMR